MKKVLKLVPKYKLVIMLLVLALLLRLPWLYTTIERDEGSFGYTAWRMLSGDSIYLSAGDNKPPFLYTLYALPISIFGNTIIPVRMFNDLLFFISVIFFFLLVKNEYSKKIAIPSSVFYIFLMNIPAAEGPLAVSESFTVSFFVMSIYFFSLFLKKESHFHLGIAIILMSFASLIRHNALGGLFLLYFLLFKKKKLGCKEIILGAVPFVFFLFLIIYFWYTGMIPAILKTISGIHTEIPFSYSLLAILESSFILLFTFIGIVITLKRKEIKKYLLTILWFLVLIPFLCFPVSFHNLLTLAPPAAIFAGICFNTLLKKRWKKENFFIIITILLISLSLFLIVKQYPNYHFRLGQIQIMYDGFESYDQQVELASFIKNTTHPEDNVLVVGWEPGIYWLSERYPAYNFLAYFPLDSLNLSSLERIIKEKKPDMILFLKEHKALAKHFDFISNEKTVYGVSIYEMVNKDRDSCYLALIGKKKNKGICELISSPFVKPYCLALLNLNSHDCYNVIKPTIMNECLSDVALAKKDSHICDMINNDDFFNFCISRLKGKFNQTACINSLNSVYGNEVVEYKCRINHAQLMNDTSQCDYIRNSDFNLICKGMITSDKTYCENIKNKNLYAYCMAQTTLNLDYCKKISGSE